MFVRSAEQASVTEWIGELDNKQQSALLYCHDFFVTV